MKLRDGEVLIGFMPDGSLESLDWREAVTEVAAEDADRPDHVVGIIPMTGSGRNLDDLFEAELEDAKRDMAEAARYERDASTHLVAGGRAL